MEIGKVLLRFENLDSTNDYAHKLIKIIPEHHGICIQACYQYAGRGQQNSRWLVAANQNLTLSILLQPKNLPAKNAFKLTEYISVVLCDLLQSYTDKKVRIKWPNDIYIEREKAIGFLVETQLSGQNILSAIVGIGINVLQTNFDGIPNATSMAISASKKIDLVRVRNQLFEKLSYQYSFINTSIMRKAYLKKLYQLNTWSRYQDSNGLTFRGMIVDVTENGLLCILHEQGDRKHYFLKEISFL